MQVEEKKLIEKIIRQFKAKRVIIRKDGKQKVWKVDHRKGRRA